MDHMLLSSLKQDTYKLIWSIAETKIERKASGNKEIV